MSEASNAAIVGTGQTEFSKDSGRSELQIACEAIRAALDDAGLAPSDVDGMSTYTIDNNEDVDVARSIGVQNLRFSSRVGHGGGAQSGRSRTQWRRSMAGLRMWWFAGGR